MRKKHDSFPNTLGFLVFIIKNNDKAHPPPKAAGGAIKFSAEIMVNRATRQIVECI